MVLLDPIPLHIVLYQPEIPANTGNIGRLCVGCGAELHLIKPLRFIINDRMLKRAGLDYWDKLTLHLHHDLAEIYQAYPVQRIFLCTTKSDRNYTSVRYQPGDVLVFGPESRGLPEPLLQQYPAQTISIPMTPAIRSINLSNAVSIILYEAVRQIAIPPIVS
ncbi:MAG: tRNA (cytidine(34)-2'-O)-methyltransferase [Candidatus Cloacimonetes bacterium]|nr:tRNA (cytidine(34)-2'-O)-methyltransferase [Candidatus Cloacimonadota bacterium]